MIHICTAGLKLQGHAYSVSDFSAPGLSNMEAFRQPEVIILGRSFIAAAYLALHVSESDVGQNVVSWLHLAAEMQRPKSPGLVGCTPLD